jgi:hypothetical protein
MKNLLILILLNLIMSLFTHSVADTTKLFPLSDILQNDFSLVSQIDVQFGDGKKLIINDKDQINEIVRHLKEINLEKSEDQTQSHGYLYFLDLSLGDKKVRYSSDLWFDHTRYQANQQTKEFDKLIVEYGRKIFPNLLPGIIQ